MNPFKRTGFDTLIGKEIVIQHAALLLAKNSCTIIDGNVFTTGIEIGGVPTDSPDLKTTLVVNGLVKRARKSGLNVDLTDVNIIVPNVTVTGTLECDTLIVEGLLSVKSGGKIFANKILYRTLHVESDAILSGSLAHLDHVSEGESYAQHLVKQKTEA